MYGNGWPGSTASGVRTGKTRSSKNWSSERTLGFGRVRVRHDVDALAAQGRHELVEERRVEPLDQTGDHLADRGQLLRRRAAVDRRPVDAGHDLVLQRGDAHLEELVEVRRGDRAELGAFEQRDARLGGEAGAPAR